VEHPAQVATKLRESRLKTIKPATSNLKQFLMAQWLADNAPTKSGEKNVQILKHTTFVAAYEAYTVVADAKEVPKFVPMRFCQLLREWGVRPLRYD